MGALEAAFGHSLPLTGPLSWEYGFRLIPLISVPCLGRPLILSSPYRLHAGLIHLFMDLLYWSASRIFRLCLPRARSEIHSLLLSHCCHHYSYPDFSIYTPSNPTFLCFVLYHFPCMVPSPIDFRVLTTLTPYFLSVPLFLAFDCFRLLL